MQESLSRMIDYHITVEETLSTSKQWAGHLRLNLIRTSLLRPVKASEVNFEIKKDWLDENTLILFYKQRGNFQPLEFFQNL